MNIGYITPAARGATDKILTEVALRLQAEGVRLAGVIQTNIDCAGRHHCDMDVTVLNHGAVLRISQNLGEGSSGCRLDPAVLEEAVAMVETTLAEPVDMMILNKFGRHEAEGRGFRSMIGEALMRGLPVLTSVNAMNQEAFNTFTDGLAEALPADTEALLDWCRSAMAAQGA